MADGLCGCTAFLEAATVSLTLGRRMLVEGNREDVASGFLRDARTQIEAMGRACPRFEATDSLQAVTRALSGISGKDFGRAREHASSAVEAFRAAVRAAACAANTTRRR